jgi:hypothetical protein
MLFYFSARKSMCVLASVGGSQQQQQGRDDLYKYP